MLKRQNGITLVALVITIIVLLILAGVSVSMVTGQDGMLTRAESAVSRNAAGSAREQIDLAFTTIEMDYQSAYASGTVSSRNEYYTLEKLNATFSDGYVLTPQTSDTVNVAANYEFTNAAGTVATKFGQTGFSTTATTTTSLLNQKVIVSYTKGAFANNIDAYYYLLNVGERGVTEVEYLGYTSAK